MNRTANQLASIRGGLDGQVTADVAEVNDITDPDLQINPASCRSS